MRRRRRRRPLTAITFTALAVSLALWWARPRPAHACGGCFSGDTITSVSSHRMVVAVGTDHSILWDQIRYTGSPADFVWVLPVPSTEPTIAVADEAFFAELDSQTAPVVYPPSLPPLDCPPPPGGQGFEDGGAAASADGGVDVYSEQVVGPYQTVVIGSADPTALVTWLNDNGYRVPSETTPVIGHYTDLGMKFVVMRLAPDQGVQAMQPIRVEYAGALTTFPLQMVAVGAYGSLSMTLWILAEQRYRSTNYATVDIDPARLVWDFATGRSNYSTVLRQTIDQAGGRAWVTQVAAPLSSFYIDSSELDEVNHIIRYPFLTRLTTDMLVDYLDADLELGPSDGGWLDRTMVAASYINAPARQCPDYDGDGLPDTWPTGGGPHLLGCGGCSATSGAAPGGLLLAALALGLGWRRHRA